MNCPGPGWRVTAPSRCRPLLAGKIEHTQDSLRQLVIHLDPIDAAIHILHPSIELERSRTNQYLAIKPVRMCGSDMAHLTFR